MPALPSCLRHKMGKIYESTLFETLFLRQGKDAYPIEMGLERWPVWLPQITALKDFPGHNAQRQDVDRAQRTLKGE